MATCSPALLGIAALASLTAGCKLEDAPAPSSSAPRVPQSRVAVPLPAPPRVGAAITAPFTDDFNRAELGPDWYATDPAAYRIVDGALVARMAHNHPLWLERRLPRDASIDLDCWSASDDGDLKVEAWGDGRSYAGPDLRAAYTSTAYNFIFGGWRNTTSTLARMHEHGEDRQTRSDLRVTKGQKYHWTITRKGTRVEWLIDGKPFLGYDDGEPLDGDGHAFFAFTDWEAELHFDNLVIKPL